MSKLKKAVEDPNKAIRHLLKIIRGRFFVRFNGLYQEPNSENIINKSWDILVILDACRYDILKSENPWNATCDRVVSQDTNTLPWFKHNFLDIDPENSSDIAYVTANARINNETVPSDWFKHLELVHKYAWDDDIGTVHPDDVTDAALQVYEKYPNQRLVVHYLQPHGPLVGSNDPFLHQNNYEPLRKGEVSKAHVLDMYRQTLNCALKEINRLIQYVSGNVVVTADHGEAFGEGGLYGHPPGMKSEQLLHVPWIELQGEGEDTPDSILEKNRRSGHVDVDDRLSALGYK